MMAQNEPIVLPMKFPLGTGGRLPWTGDRHATTRELDMPIAISGQPFQILPDFPSGGSRFTTHLA